MPKVIEILEGYVEWIAIGLGALFVMLMIYLYVLTPVATVEVGGEARGPGKVDTFLREGIATELEAEMGSTKIPDMKVPEFAETFKSTIARQSQSVATLDNPPIFNPRRTNDKPIEGPGPNDPERIVKRAKGLPELPEASITGTSTGLTNAMVPDSNVPRDPNNPAQIAMVAADVQWVTVEATIDARGITSAFTAAGIPADVANTFNTMVLMVELEREEKMPDGTYGAGESVKPLRLYDYPPFPHKDDRQSIAVYEDWASRNGKVILQPDFYDWKAGDRWSSPSEVREEGVKPVADEPAGVTPGQPTGKLTREEQAAIKKAKQEEIKRQQEEKKRLQQEKNRNTQQPRQPAGPRGQTPREPSYAPPRDGPPIPLGPGGGWPPTGQAPGVARPPAMGGAPRVQGELPTGMFDPRDLQFITVWAHDESAVPGRTYRYRVRYVLRSPIYRSNLVEKADLAKEYALVSAWSDPTDDVTVPARTNYFVFSGVRPNRPVIGMEIFTRHEGKVVSKVFEVSPGDQVGGSDGDIDFTTGWVVVDFRRDLKSDEIYVLLVDQNGNLDRRDFRTDQNKQQYRDLKQERDVAQQQAVAR